MANITGILGWVVPIGVVLIIILAVRRFTRVGRGMVHAVRGSVLFSDRVWNWHEGEPLQLTDLIPEAAVFGKSVNGGQLPSMTPTMVLEGQTGSVRFKLFRLAFSIPGAPSVLQLRIQFPATFPGRMSVMHVKGAAIGHDTDLESIRFNKETIVQASSDKVAYATLSPDFMDWYLTVAERPLLIFEGDTCYCTIMELGSSAAFDTEGFVNQLVHHIQHSGALSGA